MDLAKGNVMESLSARPRISIIADGLWVAAPAKINLNLLVGARRADGYHPLDSLVAKVTLYDQIELRSRRDGGITFSCHGADCGPDEQNLALRAARALANGRKVPGADIMLRKAIPPGKGLAGGSSDAAAVLAGLNELWRLGLGEAELSSLAAGLGSDAPLFLGPPALRMTGRGERIEPVSVHPFVAVLWMGDLACSTAEVYKAFDRAGPAAMGSQLDVALLREPPSRWRGLLVNQLAPAAEELFPQLRQIRQEMAASCGLAVHMTGSGSALFALCDGLEEARRVLAGLAERFRRECLLAGSNPW